MASPSQSAEKRPFRAHLCSGRRMMEKGKRRVDGIARARLQAQGSLRHRAEADFRFQILADSSLFADSLKSRHGEDQSIDFSVVEFSQPGIDVSTNGNDLKVAPVVQDLCPAPQAPRADAGPGT